MSNINWRWFVAFFVVVVTIITATKIDGSSWFLGLLIGTLVTGAIARDRYLEQARHFDRCSQQVRAWVDAQAEEIGRDPSVVARERDRHRDDPTVRRSRRDRVRLLADRLRAIVGHALENWK